MKPSTTKSMPPVYRQVRWWILAMLFFVTVMNFIDRQALSVLEGDITKEFHLTATQYGSIVSAFRAGMLLGEFPMGMLMDRIGVRIGLSLAVLWWSLGSGLHAVSQSLWQFRVFRFWLGTGECGNYSGGNKVVAQWFPVRERALAIGIFNSASMLGAFVAAFLIVPLRDRYGWRMGFLVPSLIGVLWVGVWWFFYRQPHEHRSLTEAEATHITSDTAPEPGGAPPTNWQLLRLPQTWGLILCRFWVGPVVEFYMNWMPKYFRDVRGMSFKGSAYFSSATFIFGDIGSIGGGVVAGLLIAKGFQVKSARQATLFIGAALCLLSFAVPMVQNVPLAIAAISLVLLGHTFLSANMFASISDVFPNSAVARVTGLTGVANGVSGMLFPLVTGMIVDRFSYLPVFFMAALMPMIGILLMFVMLKDYRKVEVGAAA